MCALLPYLSVTGNVWLRPVVCLGGFGLNEGALAATVSHDSHNIVVIGRSAEEMALAVNQVIQDGGGLCVVRNGGTKSSTVAHCRADEHRHGAVAGGTN